MEGALAFGLTLLLTHTAAFWFGIFVACCAVRLSMKHDPAWWRARLTWPATEQEGQR